MIIAGDILFAHLIREGKAVFLRKGEVGNARANQEERIRTFDSW